MSNNKFIIPARETVAQIIAERNHGRGCICDDCLIFEFLGAQDAKEKLPGSFLVGNNVTLKQLDQ